MITIEILEDDIFSLNAEALVNPANCQPTLLFGSHINEYIRKHSGPQVARERKEHGAISLGDAVTTSGGNLSNKFIIHAAVLDMFDFNPFFLLKLKRRTSPVTLSRATMNSLRAGVGLGCSSVAFSPMGTGIGGMAMKECANIMLREVSSFMSPETNLEKIIFSVKDRKSKNIFEDCLKEISGK